MKGEKHTVTSIQTKDVYWIQNGHNVNFLLKLEPITILEKTTETRFKNLLWIL